MYGENIYTCLSIFLRKQWKYCSKWNLVVLLLLNQSLLYVDCKMKQMRITQYIHMQHMINAQRIYYHSMWL